MHPVQSSIAAYTNWLSIVSVGLRGSHQEFMNFIERLKTYTPKKTKHVCMHTTEACKALSN